jgi:hypothetical protein
MKIRYQVVSQIQFRYHFSGGLILKLRLRDGCEVEYLESIKRGNSDNTIDTAEILAKFKNNTSRTLPRRSHREDYRGSRQAGDHVQIG